MAAVLDKRVPNGSTKRRRKAVSASGSKGKAASRVRSAPTAKGATRKHKREKVARAPSLWVNRLLIVVASGAVLAAAAQGMVFLQGLPVERITVSGELERTQAQQVQEMVQVSLDGGFLSANLHYMAEQLQSLPWVYQANVRRRWPSTLAIHVVEQLPIAQWGEGSYLNHEGVVFESPNVAQSDTLPRLRGPEGAAPAMMAKYQRLVEILAPLNLTVSQLSQDERGQIEVVLGSGARLLVGGAAFRERMQRFVAIYPSQLAPRLGDIERVDLRYSSGIAVAFRESQPTQPGDQPSDDIAKLLTQLDDAAVGGEWRN